MIKIVHVYSCWRNSPFECRNKFESNEQLPRNATQCPKCGSYDISYTTEERKIQEDRRK